MTVLENALALSPDDSALLQRCARLAFEQGRYADSLEYFQRAVSADPLNGAAHAGLGAVLHKVGRLAEAKPVLERAVQLDAQSAVAHDNLGVVLRMLGERDNAMEHHRRALALKPDFARAHANYGLALEQAGKAADSEAAYREALRLDATIASAHTGLGRIHHSRDEFELADSAFRAALKLEPERLTALAGLANALMSVGNHKGGLQLHRKAVRLAPNNAETHLGLAQALSTAARDHEALRIYRKLERAGIGGPSIWFGKAAALSNLGRVRAADHWYRKAFKLDPGSLMRSSYFFMLHASVLKSRSAMLRELPQWERYHGAPQEQRRTHHKRNRDPDRPLRIGYLSPDFRQHVVRQFFEPVLWNHDPDNVEIFCYSEVNRPDFATQSVSWVADRWFKTWGINDAEVAERIDRDRIDVLVDLAGHTAHHRLGVMSYRPAPVQATHLGYFGSTGLSTIDYWITDDVVHPPDTEEPAIETIYRLPRCAFCYGVPRHAPAVSARDDDRPLTFGCFNNASKVSLDVVDTWTEILSGHKQARLVLKDRRFAFGSVRRMWRQRFQRRGINDDRVDLLPGSPHPEYMQAYNAIDIALDPFPRTGGTTTCDALWMGTPVVTLAGGRYVQRLSATKLAAVGVPELITTTREGYIEKALELANDKDLRAEYHASLRQRMAKSPLCDPVSLAKALEDAYREMWRRYLDR